MVADEQNIHRIVTRLVEAWNSADSASFKELFAPDVDFIDLLGTHQKGCACIDWDRQNVFEGAPGESKIISSVADIRHIRPDVAVAFLRTHVKFFDGGVIREERLRPMVVLARDNGKWQICAFQSTAIADRDLLKVEANKFPR